MSDAELYRKLSELERRLEALELTEVGTFIPLAAPLTSTSWNGDDAKSTTAKTLFDLSAVFGVPAGVRAVYVSTQVRDTGSAAGSTYMILSPENGAGTGPHINKCSGFANSYVHHYVSCVPCDANGDIYYQIAASGAGTFYPVIQIWGYWL